MNHAWLAILLLTVCAGQAAGQYRIAAGPNFATLFDDVYDSSHPFLAVPVTGVLGDDLTVKVKFKAQASYNSTTPDFLVVSPSSGTTPATVFVRPNPRVISTFAPGSVAARITFTTVDQSPQSTTSVFITLVLNGGDPASISSVVNAASLRPEISPGGVASILGKNLGPPVLSSTYNSAGLFPTYFGQTTVTFNGVAVPLLYVSPGQIDVVVPRSFAGQKTADVVVSHYSQDSKPFSAPVVDTSPAILTTSLNGHGNGILNYSKGDYSANSSSNPVVAGRTLVLFATGVGAWAGEFDDGAISLYTRVFDTGPISLTIGGINATLTYAGLAVYETTGILQLNAIVPDNVPSGTQAVVLTVGQVSSSPQNVTVAVQNLE